ncbi:MAG: ABC transporter substrate-binding protein [Desulfobacterales bacterium]|nr:MAG: ABC transporter substrate-binding protein [Desulfobacterales bacterium]
MAKRSAATILFLLFLGLIPLQVNAGVPTEVVETQVNKILAKLGDPVFQQQQREVKIAQISEIVSEIFDWNELCKRTVGRDWKKMNAAQQKEFTDLFRALLERTYADRLLAYVDEKVVFAKETDLGKNKFEVQSNIITADNKEIPLYYRLIESSGQWKVYDVIIEGVSLVQNYRSQFREILAKGSAEDLLAILRQKK